MNNGAGLIIGRYSEFPLMGSGFAKMLIEGVLSSVAVVAMVASARAIECLGVFIFSDLC
jgi:hypothetical protein